MTGMIRIRTVDPDQSIIRRKKISENGLLQKFSSASALRADSNKPNDLGGLFKKHVGWFTNLIPLCPIQTEFEITENGFPHLTVAVLY